MLKCHYIGGPDVQNVEIQWNPVNATTFKPWKIGRINGVVVLKWFFK